MSKSVLRNKFPKFFPCNGAAGVKVKFVKTPRGRSHGLSPSSYIISNADNLHLNLIIALLFDPIHIESRLRAKLTEYPVSA